MDKRIFDHYKNRLTKEGKGKTRFNVIQYLCGFPGINPYEMAASLMADGTDIAFDDSSISKASNEANRRAVVKLVKERQEVAAL